ncbi:MAG: hypothetical protein PHY64_13610 [Eubacteriales bacterium]|nr:hypothetical protein [Eubacteriales bacterium]
MRATSFHTVIIGTPEKFQRSKKKEGLRARPEAQSGIGARADFSGRAENQNTNRALKTRDHPCLKTENHKRAQGGQRACALPDGIFVKPVRQYPKQQQRNFEEITLSFRALKISIP